MRIVLLTQCYVPMTISGAKLVHDLASELSRMGHEVTVVTPDDSLDDGIKISTEDGVVVVRVRTGRIRHSIRAVRAFRELRLSRIIWNAARHYFETHPCDLVAYYTPTIFWSELVENLRLMHKCGSYLILRDLFPQWLLDTGLLKRYGLVYWYFRRHELRLYGVSDVIGVQSPANLEYFSKPPLQGRYKVEVLFNWTNIDQRKRPSGEWRHKLGLQDKLIFLYGGMLGIPQDVDNLVRLAANMSSEKHCFFLLVGDGSEAARLRREIDQRGMTNIMLHPTVSQDDYLDIVAECDVGLITLRRDLKTHNLPGKMLSYMQMRKPILASINPGNDLSTVLEAHAAGLTCENGQDELLSEYARRLAHDPALRQTMGRNGHRLLTEKFDAAAAAHQITSHFSSS